MKHILFVCSGNTCRSPLAEGIARLVLGGEPELEVVVSSAGTSAVEGVAASSHSIAVAGEHGIDIGDHEARLLSSALVRDSDLIVTMGERHRETVGAIDPDALAYTFLLTSFSGEHDGDVPDPIGGSEPLYQDTYDLMHSCIVALALAVALPEFEGWKKS